MTKLLHQYYETQPIVQLRQSVVTRLSAADVAELDYLLNLVVLKAVAQLLDTAARQHAISLLRVDPSRLVVWLDQTYPLARMTSIEALTRVLLSLTVD